MVASTADAVEAKPDESADSSKQEQTKERESSTQPTKRSENVKSR